MFQFAVRRYVDLHSVHFNILLRKLVPESYCKSLGNPTRLITSVSAYATVSDLIPGTRIDSGYFDYMHIAVKIYIGCLFLTGAIVKVATNF